jgi:uncharacterized membrane protein
MNTLPKRFLLLLAASLALNLFLLGAWSARYWLRRDFDPRGGPLSAHAFLRRSGIDESDPGVAPIVRAQRTHVRERMHELGEARAQVRQALETEPFDAQKLDAALELVRERTSDMQRDMHVGVSGIARAVDADHRHKMADAMWLRPMAGRGRGPHM